MKCEDALVLINQTIDNCISEEDRRALEEHLEHCASCRALLQSYTELQAGLLSLEAEVPEQFAQGVMHRIAGESGKKRRFAFGRVSALCAAAAVLLLALSTAPVQQLLGFRGDTSETQNSSADMEAAPQQAPADGLLRAEASLSAMPEQTADSAEEGGSYDSSMSEESVSDVAAPEEPAGDAMDSGVTTGVAGAAPEAFVQGASANSLYACELEISGGSAVISEHEALQSFSFVDDGESLRAETTVEKAQQLYDALSQTLSMSISISDGAQPDDLAAIVIVP